MSSRHDYRGSLVCSTGELLGRLAPAVLGREDLAHVPPPGGDGESLLDRHGGGALGEPPHHVVQLIEPIVRFHVGDRDAHEQGSLLLIHDHHLLDFDRDLDRRFVADCHCLELHLGCLLI